MGPGHKAQDDSRGCGEGGIQIASIEAASTQRALGVAMMQMDSDIEQFHFVRRRRLNFFAAPQERFAVDRRVLPSAQTHPLKKYVDGRRQMVKFNRCADFTRS